MRRIIALALTLFVIAGPSYGARRTRKKSGSSVTRRYSRSKSRRTLASRYSKSGKPATTTSRVHLPSGPTPDRYREIQQALAAKGYYKGEANGQWSGESADALKRFQQDQNLPSDGKLNSLSLIALGLGPKRTLSAQSAAPGARP